LLFIIFHGKALEMWLEVSVWLIRTQ